MRVLRILIPAIAAVAAIWVVGVASAQAAGEKFHCSVEPCIGTLHSDGAAGTKTAHHVLIVRKIIGGVEKSGTFTCNELTGKGESATLTTAEVTVQNLIYDNCTIAGVPVTVDPNGCDYLASAEGGVDIKCPAGAKIQLTVDVPVKCTVSVPGQELKGLTYHNIGAQNNNTTEVTVQVSVKGVTGEAGAGCVPYVGFEGAFTEAEYTTGNTIVTGESNIPAMANAWWA